MLYPLSYEGITPRSIPGPFFGILEMSHWGYSMLHAHFRSVMVYSPDSRLERPMVPGHSRLRPNSRSSCGLAKMLNPASLACRQIKNRSCWTNLSATRSPSSSSSSPPCKS